MNQENEMEKRKDEQTSSAPKLKAPFFGCFQLVEKVQRKLGFLSYMWYNVYGDDNAGKERKEQRTGRNNMP